MSKPKQCIQHFPGQKEGEQIKYLVLKHWIIYVKLSLFIALTMGIPTIIWAVTLWAVDSTANTKEILTLGFLVYLQIMLLISYIRWLEEELDIIIVTNERVINIEQVSFMHRTISETELSQIQDVKHVSKGILSNVLGFGSLQIQTAADKVAFAIHDIPHAFDMARHIMDLRNEYIKKFRKEHGVIPGDDQMDILMGSTPVQ